MNYLKEKEKMASPEEILIILFKNNKIDKFNRYALHEAFYKLKDKEEYKGLLHPFRFSGSKVNIYSKEISIAILNLLYCNIIQPDDELHIKASSDCNMDLVYENICANLNTETRILIEQFCEDLKIELLKIN